jgi:hypothetical protein
LEAMFSGMNTDNRYRYYYDGQIGA